MNRPREIETHRATVDTCGGAAGAVVIIDVLRAFTTAAHAFARGAQEILLVSTVAEGFALKRRHPNYLLMGEVDGLPIDGFDLPNSPAAVAALDLSARRMIMRTSAGTQGIVRAVKGAPLLAASLCVASATARKLKSIDARIVTLVATGVRAHDSGEEDVACADLIAALLRDESPNIIETQERVLNSRAAAKFLRDDHPAFRKADLELALEIDRFDFAMEVERRNDTLALRVVSDLSSP